ncbi:hypothetical protein [Geoglobus acetivorans]|uniref:Uncharacterized protein n=1 Tax=Geoglobus acetivorans TaxID=565033 RepID=A0A0A7GIV6_GEOAI|nr:hypothetical protein GACE_1841 [Geoglobus acetivorans]
MVGIRTFLILVAGILVFVAVVSAQNVPYFPVTVFPENPRDGDTVEAYVSNYEDLAGSARFQWIHNGTVYREVTKDFTSTSISDSFVVFPGSWEVVVYVYDRSDPPKLINYSSVSFDVVNTSPLQTPTPTPEPTATLELTPTPKPTPQPAQTPELEESLTPAPVSTLSGGSTGGGGGVPSGPGQIGTPGPTVTPGHEINGTSPPQQHGTENAEGENVTESRPNVVPPQKAPGTSGEKTPGPSVTENRSTVPGSVGTPGENGTAAGSSRGAETPAFTVIAALLSVLAAVWLRHSG